MHISDKVRAHLMEVCAHLIKYVSIRMTQSSVWVLYPSTLKFSSSSCSLMSSGTKRVAFLCGQHFMRHSFAVYRLCLQCAVNHGMATPVGKTTTRTRPACSTAERSASLLTVEWVSGFKTDTSNGRGHQRQMNRCVHYQSQHLLRPCPGSLYGRN